MSDKGNRKYNIWWPQNTKGFSSNFRVKCFEWLKEKRVLWDLGTNYLPDWCRETTIVKAWEEADFGLEFRRVRWTANTRFCSKKQHKWKKMTSLFSTYITTLRWSDFIRKKYLCYSFWSTGLGVLTLSVDAVPHCVQLN